MTDYGVLGICFVVLYFLGYASNVLLTIGIILVIISSYISHIQYKSLLQILFIACFGIMDDEEE
jgi:hypothetical protein